MNEPCDEEWRDIPGYEGYYQASSMGRVRSLDRVVSGRGSRGAGGDYWRKGQVLKPWSGTTGYETYGLSCGKEYKRERGHRLVALAFIPNPNDYPFVRHLNDDRLDNRVENLAWGTLLDNQDDQRRNFGAIGQGRKTHCKRGHEYTPESTYIFPNGKWRMCKTCRRELYWEKRRADMERGQFN